MKSSKIDTSDLIGLVKGHLTEAKFDFEDSLILIAVSGGVDSMVLLDLLTLLDISGIVVHVDHGIRPDSSSDADFVARQAKMRGHKFESERFDVFEIASKKKQSIEEAGRDIRYSFFEKVSKRFNAQFITLGHHEDDQAETVLMNLIRGSGSRGLSGMSGVREERYLRPMLLFPKKIICEYALKRNLQYREDETNKNLRFVRNRIRYELLPVLESYNPKIKYALSRTAVLLRDDDEFIEQKVKESLNDVMGVESKDCVSLDVSRLLSYHIAIQRRVVRNALIKVGFTGGFPVVEETIRLLGGGNSSVRYLSNSLRIQSWEGKLYLNVEQFNPLLLKIPTTEKSECNVGFGTLCVRQGDFSEFKMLTASMAKGIAVFDAKELSDSVIVRSIRTGDRFSPLGLHGHKKLSDFLIDEKYPAIFRQRVIVVESRGEIVWVVGMRSSEYCKVVNDTETIVIMEFFKNGITK